MNHNGLAQSGFRRGLPSRVSLRLRGDPGLQQPPRTLDLITTGGTQICIVTTKQGGSYADSTRGRRRNPGRGVAPGFRRRFAGARIRGSIRRRRILRGEWNLTAVSDGQWSRTNDRFHDEVRVTSTRTITSTYNCPRHCSMSAVCGSWK